MCNSVGNLRAEYRSRVLEAARNNERVVVVDADTESRPTPDQIPLERYFDIGIAEQNLIGVASGLARVGLLPFVTCFATFATARAGEFVKVDVAHANLPVRIAGTHAGLSAGPLGRTHYALEDVAWMRTLPNMTVVVPADEGTVHSLVDAALSWPAPIYVRLPRGQTPVPTPADGFTLGRVLVRHGGADVTLIACGPNAVCASLHARCLLMEWGIDAGVVEVHTVKPLDASLLEETTRSKAAVVVEEHSETGGLGSAVCELVCLHDPIPVVRIGVVDALSDSVAAHQMLLEHHGITSERVARAARNLLEPRRECDGVGDAGFSVALNQAR